jgi:hypothetical protein
VRPGGTRDATKVVALSSSGKTVVRHRRWEFVEEVPEYPWERAHAPIVLVSTQWNRFAIPCRCVEADRCEPAHGAGSTRMARASRCLLRRTRQVHLAKATEATMHQELAANPCSWRWSRNEKRSAEPDAAQRTSATRHSRTAPGRRPLRGVVQALLLLGTRAFRLRVAVSVEAGLDARESIEFLTRLHSGRGSSSVYSPGSWVVGQATMPGQCCHSSRFRRKWC